MLHLENVEDALREIHRVLADKGWVLLFSLSAPAANAAPSAVPAR